MAQVLELLPKQGWGLQFKSQYYKKQTQQKAFKKKKEKNFN
jgi:hypothetical protein